MGAVCAWFALRGASWEAVGSAFQAVRWTALLPVAVIFFLQQVVRAWRQWFLVLPGCPEARYRTQLSILCISFFCINSLPARAGELVRPWLLKRKEGLPLGAGLAVVVVERLLDLASALGLLGLGLAFGSLQAGPHEVWGQPVDLAGVLRTVGLGVVLPTGALLGLLAFRGEGMLVLAGRLLGFLPVRGESLLALLRSFVTAMEGLRISGRVGPVVALTAVTWLGTGAMILVLAHGCGLDSWIAFPDALGVLAITMLATALPAPPGFVGVYEAGVLAGLAVFGVPAGVLGGAGLVFALVLHWWTFTVQAATAAGFFFVDEVAMSDLFYSSRRTRSP